MKKKIVIASALVFPVAAANAQVTVEVVPTTWDKVANAKGFTNANDATTDLFTKNSPKRTVGIPENYMGTQDAVEGDAYFGIITYHGDGVFDASKFFEDGLAAEKPGYEKYGEYVQMELPSELKAGQEYTVVFKASLADKSKYATNIGALLSKEKISNPKNVKLDNAPQITSPVIKDMDGWVEVKQNIKANGGEKYLIIGAFNSGFQKEANTPKTGNAFRRAYYYVGAISVKEYIKPDRDKDGITDDMDKCPDVAGIKEFDGCPDTDGDGITDAQDKCPSVKGLSSFQGCPDTDGDGITDAEDKCPAKAGVKENKGCPVVVISEKTKQIFEKALTGIQFESGKDVIKKTSYPILDNVAQIMKENPNYFLNINGHTDSQGDDNANQVLSDKRAAAVKKYIENKGIEGRKMASKGWGETQPIADNKTAAGRAKNRRVEFKVEFTE